MKLEWTESPDAVWPEARYRAVGDKHEYVIILDPEAENIRFPEDAEGEWWAVVVRALDGDEAPATFRRGTLVHTSANRTLSYARRDAQIWEDSA